jgi:hypothetical protein
MYGGGPYASLSYGWYSSVFVSILGKVTLEDQRLYSVALAHALVPLGTVALSHSRLFFVTLTHSVAP